MTTIRTGQSTIPTLTQRDTTATTGVAQPAPTPTAAGAARTATTLQQDGFQAARTAPVALAATQARTFNEVLPQHAAQETQAGTAMGDAALNRVLDHVEQTFGRRLNTTERNEWMAVAREESKKGGDEDAVWGRVFSKLNTAS